MGCCNDTSTVLAGQPPTPTQHVNYTKGMVLGVDDFTQEFTYLSVRDQWAIGEILGYGTTSGLAVSVEDDGADGPRIHVKSGAAAAPSGKLICVPSEQCCLIKDWLAKPDNTKTINSLLPGSPPNSPPAAPQDGLEMPLSLYLTLCYTDCKTAPVPIPGEPCRSEDMLMAPSRIADNYRLELRTVPPMQREEYALRDFAALLARIPVIDIGPTGDVDQSLVQRWSEQLRHAVKPWVDASKDLSSLPPVDYVSISEQNFDLSPPGEAIARDQFGEFLRLAFRLWVTELRPIWMTRHCGAVSQTGDDCLLLAQLEVPVQWVGGSPPGSWVVNGNSQAIVVDESQRPYLVHMRLLQEYLQSGWAAAPWSFGSPPFLSAGSSPTFKGLTTTGDVQIAISVLHTDQTLDSTQHCVICKTGLSLALPRCQHSNRGRVYIIKSLSANSIITSHAGDDIDGAPSYTVNSGKAVTLVSDGVKTWHIISALA
jgi:hypothetical protein